MVDVVEVFLPEARTDSGETSDVRLPGRGFKAHSNPAASSRERRRIPRGQ
jgi:hypothetical protein